MTQPDIRAYYAALGIELAAWAQHEAPVRCFAAPDAHQHQDRGPSCSVNLENGVWHCHGCGAGGGPYDAALQRGHTPRSAIDLMIDHRLTHRRGAAEQHAHASRQFRQRSEAQRRPSPPEAPARPRFTIAERDLRRWQQALARHPALLASLTRERGWSYQTMRELELGLDQLCQRITIPIRDPAGQLQGLLRYDPSPTRRNPKMRAAPGTRLGLMPHPAHEPSQQILLVEGPPDMIAARSHGLPAIAVPSASAWKPEWAPVLADRDVSVIMDSDPAGRHAAAQIAADLLPIAAVRVVDLAPARQGGYDLTDRLLERPHEPIAQHEPNRPRALPAPRPYLSRSPDPPASARAT